MVYQKHNKYQTRLYSIYANMKKRCYNTKSTNYVNYGDRGIAICKEWLSDFESFYNWAMANGYSSNLSIDRINNDGDYKPSNCRWTTKKVQNRNTKQLRRTNKSGYRGVYYDKSRKMYAVQICVNNKKMSLGRFNCRLQAAYAYDNFVTSNNLEHTINFK